MALNFTPSDQLQADTSANIVETKVVEQETAQRNIKVAEPQSFSMVETSNNLKNELVKNDEINKLVSTININDTNSIVKFGSEAADDISKASDQVLNSMNMEQINDTGVLLTALANIMEKFDATELEKEEKKGFFTNLKKQIDKILDKYTTMGNDVDKIYVQLKQYESEIQQSNVKLESMYNANIEYYKKLLKYIMAGEQACVELDGYIEEYRQKVAANPDSGTAAMDLQTLENTRAILEQRVMDLKIAENVAMQTVPMLKTMEYSNVNLVRKIDSAFIITLPIFKQSLAQAVMLKRQRVIADGMKALDDTTNKLMIKNAENTVNQSKAIAQMANSNSISVDTLEKTWQTIVNGIEETKQIQEDAKVRRKQDSERLQQLKEDYKRKMNS
ncbi:MAG: toxic anion resistance protein [Oscillospiraceae bacterium]|nr:toxic anion resistance protein [Oscillospiraceae bacterium]MDD7429448.1 toxic anion resistance protein [Oscillospiraceae bacterium]MDY2846931.1 toxic anion resistance protein [Oscillospiraceae bacterium]